MKRVQLLMALALTLNLFCAGCTSKSKQAQADAQKREQARVTHQRAVRAQENQQLNNYNSPDKSATPGG